MIYKEAFIINNIRILKESIDEHENIVFFGGAGVSTESGIPDFRSEKGLYSNYENAETLLSYSYFVKYPEKFMEFYRTKLIYLNAKPNKAHDYLSRLENVGKLKAIVTQNVDGLHQKAGSMNVIELHGTSHRCHCDKCKMEYNAEIINKFQAPKKISRCSCGGVIRPSIIMYEELLDERVVKKAMDAIINADMLIIAGTSMAVYPAASYIDFFKGDCLVVINKTPIQKCKANIVICDNVGQTFEALEHL